MEKTARRASADPNQEKLRQTKAAWNKDVSAFVNDLIHFKKMMNGWPSKFFKERSRITQPIPADPATIIGSLASDFQEIASRGNTIIQEQLNYSKTRRQKQPKQMNLPLGQPEAKPQTPEAESVKPDLSKQLSLGLGASDASSNYRLISEGSNFLTRFFSKILSPGIGFSEAARVRKLRVSLLNAAAKVSKDLRIFQKEIVPLFSGPESIKTSSIMLSNVENGLIFLMAGLKSYQDALPQGAVDTGGKIDMPKVKEEEKLTEEKSKTNVPTAIVNEVSAPDPRLQKAEFVVDDVIRNRNSFSKVPGLRNLFSLVQKWRGEDEEGKLQDADTLIITHRNLVNQICLDRKLPNQSSLSDIVALGTKNASSAQNELQAVAQNILGKWRHQLSIFDKTSSFRLDIYRMAANARKINNEIMNKLEKGLNTDELLILMAQLDDAIKKIRDAMTALGATTKGMSVQPQFMNMLQNGRIGDHAVNLSPQQKTRLERLLERKQNTELMKMYGR